MILEFIFSHKDNFRIWVASALCTEPDIPNGNQCGVPFALSVLEARSILVLLSERGLMVRVGDLIGEPFYHIQQAKDAEWRELIANTREIGWIERHRWPILKTIGVFVLFSLSIIYTSVLQKVTEHKIDDLQRAASKVTPSGSLHESQTNSVHDKQTK